MENTPSPRPSPKKAREGSPADSDGYNSTEEKGNNMGKITHKKKRQMAIIVQQLCFYFIVLLSVCVVLHR